MKSLIPVIAIVLITIQALAQTNVSGGIYANATWTKANSPYIVTDTVVVFPGVTLTIEPGVEVRFDNNIRLELRQANLIALGTTTDSITFTSNASSPHPGSWDQIWLNGGSTPLQFSYCNFHYANKGANGNISSLTHCVISNNITGCSLSGSSTTIVDSCNIIYNTTSGISGGKATVSNSQFSDNGTGISITTGTTTNCNYSDNGTGITIENATIANCNFLGNTRGIYIVKGTVTHCNFSGNGTAIYRHGPQFTSGDNCRISNCILNHNTTGIYDASIYCTFESYTIVDSCIISHNTSGVSAPFTMSCLPTSLQLKNSLIDSNTAFGVALRGESDLVMNCQITNNGIGLTDSLAYGGATIEQNRIEYNVTGLRLKKSVHHITCNKICNNSSNDLFWRTSGSPNWSGNYWCTTDSAAIEAKIYDGYDNINFGLVKFMPMDTSQCYLTGTSISGAILAENGIPIQGVTVTLSGDDTQTTITGSDGRYGFSVAQNGNYTVAPFKNNDIITNNGITLMDVLLTRRHLLGTPLSTPYKIIAADVDSSSIVSTFDILLMRSMILQSITTFPNGKLWSFVPSDYVFPDLVNPFPFPSTKTYTNLQQTITNQDFIGIKLGDVNGSWDANIP